jgi:integrase
MTAAKAAMQFRDGLIIALLIARPTLRLRNLTALELGRTVVRHGGQWRIDIPAPETKTKRAIHQMWPEDLIEPLEAYLDHHRPVLVQLRRRSARPPGEALWVSRHGSPLDRRTIYANVTRRTRDGLGHAINPHLFRDCCTTTIAIEDPEHIGIASPLLGHLTPATTEKYYNQARSIEALRRLQQVVLALRAKAAGSAADRP